MSLLGKYITRSFSSDFELFGTYHNQSPKPKDFPYTIKFKYLNITDSINVAKVIHDVSPDIVIHLASLSIIDYCEKNPRKTNQVNVMGTKNVVSSIKNKNIHLIFISSNAVFDGTKAPYTETDALNPINIYGKSKLDAEKLVMDHPHMTIVRFTTLFGWPPYGARDNDLSYYLPKLIANKTLYLVNDRFFNPISVRTASQGIQNVIKKKSTGVFHIAGKERISRYTFVRQIARAYDIKNISLIPVKSDHFPNSAKRPSDATLNTQKMRHLLEINPRSLKSELKDLQKESRSLYK